MIDDPERQAAAEIEQSNSRWMVMWGCYSRLFWAYPLFLVPKGTIVSAPDRDQLLATMHSVEVEASTDSRVPAPEPPGLAARLPVRSAAPARSAAPERTAPERPTPGQTQRGALPVANAPVSVSGQAQAERAMYDPYDSGPLLPLPYGFGPHNSDRRGFGPDYPDRYGFEPDDPERHGFDPDDPDRYGFEPDDPERHGFDPDDPDRYGFDPDDSDASGQGLCAWR